MGFSFSLFFGNNIKEINMKTIKEYLVGYKHIIFRIREGLEKDFLSYVRDNNCHWINGESITDKVDEVSTYMGVSEDLSLGKMPIQCLKATNRDNIKIIDFKN